MAEAEIELVDASIEIESPTFNGTVTVRGNTVTVKEGTGEVTVEAATNGGVPVMVHSRDVTTKVGMVKFEMPGSVKSHDIARSIALSPLGTVVARVSGTDDAGNRYGRTLRQGSMTNDPDKAIQQGGNVPIEMSGAPLTQS